MARIYCTAELKRASLRLRIGRVWARYSGPIAMVALLLAWGIAGALT